MPLGTTTDPSSAVRANRPAAPSSGAGLAVVGASRGPSPTNGRRFFMKTQHGWPAKLAQRHVVRGVVVGAVLFAGAMSAWALTDLTTVRAVDGTVMDSIGGHISQGSLTQQVQAGD